MGTSHPLSVTTNNHAITGAAVYANIAARDADTAFFTTATNLDKVVKVTSPLAYYTLAVTGGSPTWLEFSSTGNDQWIELTDTPSSITANLVVQGNSAGTALEFGQNLKTTASPQFVGLTLTGDLTVGGTTTTINSTTLTVDDKNIELGSVATPTDVTADGGGITLKGTTDKTIAWSNAKNRWVFNQGIELNAGQVLRVNEIEDTGGDSLSLIARGTVPLELGSGSGGIQIDSSPGKITLSAGTFIEFDNHLGAENGTELLPTYSFKNDFATGMRLSATNILNFSARGFDVLQLTAPLLAVNFMTMTAGTFDDPDGVKLSVDGSQADINFDISSKGVNTLRLNVSGSGNVEIGPNSYVKIDAGKTMSIGSGVSSVPFVGSGTALIIRSETPNTHTKIQIESATNGNELDIGINDTATDSGSSFIRNNDTTIMRLLTSTGEALTLSGLDVIAKASLQVVGPFKDSSGDVGTSGQILSSTVTGTNWITSGGGTVTNTGTLTDNALVRGNGGVDIDVGNITMSTDGNDLAIPGNLTFGTTSVSTGVIRLANSALMAWRNANDTADLSVGFNSNNNFEISNGSIDADTLLVWKVNNSIKVNISSTEIRFFDDLEMGGSLLSMALLGTGKFFFDGLTGNTHISEASADSLVITVGGVQGLQIQEIGTEINTVFGKLSALATTAADGFIHIPTMAGTPTGTPTLYAGKTPVVYDTTNDIAYIYNSSWKILTDFSNVVTLDGAQTITGAKTFTDTAIFQNAADSLTGFQVLDADGGPPIFNVDTINERIGVGTASPFALAHFKSGGTRTGFVSFADELALESAGDVGMSIVGGDTSNAHIVFSDQSANSAAIIRYRTSGEILTIDVGAAGTLFSIMGSGVFAYNDDALVINAAKKSGFGTAAPDTKVHVLSTDPDTTAIVTVESTGANAGETTKFVGSRDPSGNVTAAGGAEYYRDSAALSATYESREATTGTGWFKRSLVAASSFEIHTSAELDDLATAGVITISSDTMILMKDSVSTTNVFVLSGGASLQFSTNFNRAANLIYTGTGTFISGTGSVRAFGMVFFGTAGNGSTFINIIDGSFNFNHAAIVNFDNLGTITGGLILHEDVVYVSALTGFIFTDITSIQCVIVDYFGTDLPGALFAINTKANAAVLTFTDTFATNLTTAGSLLDLSTEINNNSTINILNCGVDPKGNIFKQSTLTDATINSVADGSISNGTITAQASNGSGGTTHSSTTTYFEDEEITYTGSTSYNGTFQIFNVVAGVSFDTITTFVANDATGTIASVRLAITLAAGHGISTGNNLKIIDSNFYNGFETALNIATNVLTVNGTFVGTDTGSVKRQLSVDQTDKRVQAFSNLGLADSQTLAFGSVNDNTTATNITDGTYNNLTVPTFTINQITERLRLINAGEAKWEYISNEPFNGLLTGSLSALKSGSTENYKFAMSTNSVIPDFGTAPHVSMEVKTTKVNVALVFSVSLTKGDTIKVMVAGDGTADNLTITGFIMGIK